MDYVKNPENNIIYDISLEWRNITHSAVDTYRDTNSMSILKYRHQLETIKNSSYQRAGMMKTF